MLPAFVLVAGMTVYPLYFAISYSLFDTSAFDRMGFNGLANYRSFINSPQISSYLLATGVFVGVGVVIAVVVGVALALFLRQQTLGKRLLQLAIIIPWVMSDVVAGIIWRWMINREYGPLSYVVGLVGFELPNLIGTPMSALLTVTLVNVWRSVAFPVLMALAALQSVPRELEEAARVDGASRTQSVWHVLLPSIRPVLLVTVIVLTISYVNQVVVVLTLTGGGPLSATEVFGVRIYKESFEYFNVGIAAAMSVLMLVATLALSYGYFRALDRDDG